MQTTVILPVSYPSDNSQTSSSFLNPSESAYTQYPDYTPVTLVSEPMSGDQGLLAGMAQLDDHNQQFQMDMLQKGLGQEALPLPKIPSFGKLAELDGPCALPADIMEDDRTSSFLAAPYSEKSSTLQILTSCEIKPVPKSAEVQPKEPNKRKRKLENQASEEPAKKSKTAAQQSRDVKPKRLKPVKAQLRSNSNNFFSKKEYAEPAAPKRKSKKKTEKKYPSRQAFALRRMRIGGRFISKEEEAQIQRDNERSAKRP